MFGIIGGFVEIQAFVQVQVDGRGSGFDSLHAPATIIAIVVSYGFFIYLQRRSIQSTWGDARSGVWFAMGRWSLLNLERSRWTVKNWRPNIIVFTGQPHNRQQLVEVAKWLSLGRGLVTFFQLITGDIRKIARSGIQDKARRAIQQYIADNHMSAFAEADIVPDFRTGATLVARHFKVPQVGGQDQFRLQQ